MRASVHGFGGYDFQSGKVMALTRSPWDAFNWVSHGDRMIWPLLPMPENQRASARRLGIKDSHDWEKWPAIR